MGVILVAYERESEQTALEQLLEGRGHQVVKASNGLTALDLARREPPHVVVSDIVLPRMDGFALCRKWKQDERLQSIPFIFYTRRHDDPKYERFALELGAERFLARTAQPEALAEAVDQLIGAATAATVQLPALDKTVIQRRPTRQKADTEAGPSKQQLMQEHAQALAQLKAEHERALTQAQQRAEQAVASLKREHEQALATARQALERAQEAHGRLRAQIAELEATQERIAAGEARFRRVFEANPLPMWIADHATRGFIAVNDAALKLYGYTRAEFLALTRDALEGSAQAPDQEAANVVAHKNKAGEPLFVALATESIEFDGRSADLVCAYDLTQRIQREQSRARSAAAAREVIDALGDGYLALDAEGRIVEANAAYCLMSGYTREQLLGKTLADLEQHGIDDTTARTQWHAEEGANRYETRHRRADGTVFDVEVSAGPLADGAAQPSTLLVRDITERRREAARRRSSQRQLEFLVDLFKHSEGFDESGIVRRVVDQAGLATNSPLSYLYFVDSTQKTITLAAWRERSQLHVTMATAEPRPIAQVGLFTECVKARHPTSSNDLSRKPQVDGLPDLQRYLAVPLVADDQTMAVLGVANRDAPYNEEDQTLLVSMAESVCRMLHTKRAHALTLASLQRTDVALQGVIESLVRMSERHDPYTAGSARRVATLAVALAREAGLDSRSQDAVRIAALLHDIGNIAVPPTILAKPAPLNEVELALMRTHAEEGCKLLADIDFGAPIADIILEHHERIDGSGYPRGLKGDDILIEARVIAIADTVEAMCSPRPYRPALGMDAAIDEINRNAGRLYDPHLVAACTRLVRQRGFAFPD